MLRVAVCVGNSLKDDIGEQVDKTTLMSSQASIV